MSQLKKRYSKAKITERFTDSVWTNHFNRAHHIYNLINKAQAAGSAGSTGPELGVWVWPLRN